jgi:hypothetical protein
MSAAAAEGAHERGCLPERAPSPIERFDHYKSICMTLVPTTAF